MYMGNLSKFHSELVAMGLKQGTKEWRYARRKFADNENIEKIRELDKIKSRKRRDKYGKQINANQRKNYHASRRKYLDTIKSGRIRRNPAYGLTEALREFERGDRSIDSLNRLYSERLACLNERAVQRRSGSERKASRSRKSKDGSFLRKTNK